MEGGGGEDAPTKKEIRGPFPPTASSVAVAAALAAAVEAAGNFIFRPLVCERERRRSRRPPSLFSPPFFPLPMSS